MSKINTIKGFADHLPQEAARFTHLAETAKRIFGAYGYREIQLPILEYTELFTRGIGAETDVVQKEMFTLQDRKGRSLTMRPEATAGIMRSYIENSTYAKEGVTKYFTHGPMFRYERPQKGRMRQFHQADCECLGAVEPQIDAEMMLMVMEYLTALGIGGLSLEVNTLGCRECRPAYRETLRNYLRGQDKDAFCEDCQRRMDTNPLRVLDCKVPACKEMSRGAPNMHDNVCPACREHFGTVLEIMKLAGQPYTLNHRLVRGLDYYTRTTFEVVSGAIGAQSSVCGGGRYDGLISDLGGPDIPGIGFACGLERLAMLMPELPAARPDFYIAVLDAAGQNEALLLAQRLRQAGLAGEMSYSAGSMKSQMRRADASNARYCLILGGNELAAGTVIVKNMRNGEQTVQERNSAIRLD